MPGDFPALHRMENALQPVLGAGNLTGPFYMTIQGTVNTVGGGTGGTSSIDESAFTTGGTSLTPMGALSMSLGAQSAASIGYGVIGAPKMSGQRILFMAPTTPSGGDITDNANTALRVNVVAGGAGGGVANLTVRGTANTDLHVGFASANLGAWPNQDGAAWLPVFFPSGFYPTVNTAGGGAGFATAAVYGSPAFPVYEIGSVNVVNAVGIFGSVTGIQTVNMGNIPTVNLGLGTINVGNIPNVIVGSIASGSMNVLAGQAGAPWSITGSVNAVMGTLPLPITGTTTTVPAGVQVVDTRGSLVPTQWIISFGGSGQSIITGSAPANQRIWFSSYHLVSTGTVDVQWQSPSAVAISGSFRLLPGAGFAFAGAMPNSPVLIGSQQSPIFINATGTQNVGGIAVGWIF